MRILQAVLSPSLLDSLPQLQPKLQRDNIKDAGKSKPGKVGAVDGDFDIILVLYTIRIDPSKEQVLRSGLEGGQDHVDGQVDYDGPLDPLDGIHLLTHRSASLQGCDARDLELEVVDKRQTHEHRES